MKRIHYLIISLLIAVPMWAQQTSEAVIRGTVQGFTRPLLVCNIVKEGRTPDTLKIENGKFVQSVTDWTERQEAFFQIQDENFYKQILIKLLPGKSLTLDIKKDKDDLQIVYGGELGPITEYTNLERDIYTLSKTFAPESWNQLKDFQECKSYVDTKLNQLLDALQQLDDTDFILQKRVHIESGKPQQYLSFGLHKQQTGTDMKQDAAYMDFIRNLDVNDPQNEGLLFTYLEWYHAAHPDFLSESALPDPAKKIRLVKEVILHPELRNHMAGNYLNVTLFTQMLGAKIDDILPDEFKMDGRSRQPPKNMVNSLISFGNSMMYSTVLTELYNTQLNPTISYLHEPSERRFSLALDLSEIFKPILVDRVIFYLVNKKMITKKDFNQDLNCCLLNDKGRTTFIKEYNKRLETTIKHKDLGRKVSYQRLIRLEAYKLKKHMLGMKTYDPFVIWW